MDCLTSENYVHGPLDYVNTQFDQGWPLVCHLLALVSGFMHITLQNKEVLKSVTLLLHPFQAYSHYMWDLSTF